MNAKLTVIALASITAFSGILPAVASKSEKHKQIAATTSDEVTTSTSASEAAATDAKESKKEKKHARDFNFHNYYSVN
jgi:hypothetical protein